MFRNVVVVIINILITSTNQSAQEGDRFDVFRGKVKGERKLLAYLQIARILSLFHLSLFHSLNVTDIAKDLLDEILVDGML